MKLTTHLHSVLLSGMSGVLPVLPCYVFLSFYVGTGAALLCIVFLAVINKLMWIGLSTELGS
jgi:hypothetical protein